MSIVSVRVDRRVKEVLKRAGINIAEEVRRHLEELAWRVELQQNLEQLDRLLEAVPPVEEGWAAKGVREDREGH
jgi:hypothetical protein